MELSAIRWRPPGNKEDSLFRVGDCVRIARLIDSFTSREIVGHEGVIVESDEDEDRFGIVEVKCDDCPGVHTVHVSELDFYGAYDLTLAQSSARARGPVSDDDELDSLIIVLAHRSGFSRVSLEDRPVPLRDPKEPYPVWSRYLYVTTPDKPAELSGFTGALIALAKALRGRVVEINGLRPRTRDVYDQLLAFGDGDTLTVSYPMRVTIESSNTNDLSQFDYAKISITEWFESAKAIDKLSIVACLSQNGYRVSNWHEARDQQITFWLTLPADKTHLQFRSWAAEHWVWVGTFEVHVSALYFKIWKHTAEEPAHVTIEHDDVPF